VRLNPENRRLERETVWLQQILWDNLKALIAKKTENKTEVLKTSEHTSDPKMTKPWTTPVVTVLTRRLDENVLSACKGNWVDISSAVMDSRCYEEPMCMSECQSIADS
jgi:hypothetical protein